MSRNQESTRNVSRAAEPRSYSPRTASRERDNYNDYQESDESLFQKTRQVQNESLESSRRALSKLRETELLGQKNLSTLANQSGILY